MGSFTNLLIVCISSLVFLACLLYFVLNFIKYKRKNLRRQLKQLKGDSAATPKDEIIRANVKKIPSKELMELTQEEERIIGIVEPIGFWTRLIMSEKMDFIMSKLHFESGKSSEGYWVQLIKAQGHGKGKGGKGI